MVVLKVGRSERARHAIASHTGGLAGESRVIETVLRAHRAIEVHDMDELTDSLIGHFVDQARRSGASWTDIGRSMGVTKQAAQKRFVAKAPGEPSDLDPGQGFSRFTPRARPARKAKGIEPSRYAAAAMTSVSASWVSMAGRIL